MAVSVCADDLRELLELASSTEEADGYVTEFTDCRTYADKLAFVSKLCNATIIGRSVSAETSSTDGSPSKEGLIADDYEAVLSAIINKKWR